MQMVNSPLHPLRAQSRKGSTSLMVLVRSLISFTGLPRWSRDKESTYQCRRRGFHPWVRNITWRRTWEPTKYSFLENFMERGAWWATTNGVAN